MCQHDHPERAVNAQALTCTALEADVQHRAAARAGRDRQDHHEILIANMTSSADQEMAARHRSALAGLPDRQVGSQPQAVPTNINAEQELAEQHQREQQANGIEL